MAQPEMEQLEAVVENIIFKNEDNGYTVAEMEGREFGFVAVGILFGINEGEKVVLTGTWTEHPSYGEQFKVEMYEKKMPTTCKEITRYLASGIIKGVRKATAEKIVEAFGEETLGVLSSYPEKLASIRGISLDKAHAICSSFNEQLGTSDLFMFLSRYGISANVCMKIYRKHKIVSKNAVVANPYILCDEAYGVSFKKADDIAKQSGIEPTHEKRVCAGITYALRYNLQFGHTYLPYEMLCSQASEILGVGKDVVETHLDMLCRIQICRSEIKNSGRVIYLSEYHDYEANVASKLATLAGTVYDDADVNVEKQIEIAEQKSKIKFASRQKEAVRTAMRENVMVITGGPGTGKTTIINVIIDILQSVRMKIALTAPTGRAAKRMSQVCNMEAKTIHRLLEVNYSDGDDMMCMRDESDPIDADCIIVDEMSMVDIVLMNSLLRATRPGTRLIMVGDVNQLPSVGPGNVLKDIISSSLVSVIRLDEIFRQNEESHIVTNAHAINNGIYPVCNSKDGDFFFASIDSPEAGASYICELCFTRLKKAYGFEPFDIQVLSPQKKGVTGVNNLNALLQNLLNPPESGKSEKSFGDIVFREGDKVMQIKNNYNLIWEDVTGADEGTGVFNGDVGFIHQINKELKNLTVIYDDKKVVYDFKDLSELTLAYSITVHKSQGSEFPVVVIPMFSAPEMLLSRNLLYTGVTRAKKLVVLVGRQSILKKMIDNNREDKRYSGLMEKMYIEFEKRNQ